LEEKQKFSFKSRLYSFKYAISGLKYFVRNDHNGRIHLCATILAVALSYYLNISKLEWIAIMGVITSVIVTEIINASIEKLSDVVSPEYHPVIKIVKDLAAGAVLVSAAFAVVVGVIIFIPKLSGIIG